MQDLGAGDYSKASAVSANGSVIAVNVDNTAHHWTSSGGLLSLGTFGGDWSDASGISADGNILTGSSRDSLSNPYAFRWTLGTDGLEKIGTFYSFANGISGDGTTVTGSETGSAGLHRAFSWKEGIGFTYNIAGNFSRGRAISGDGGIIVGDNGGGAFRLSDSEGLENLNTVYASLLTDGSELVVAWDISADGQYIAGLGTNNSTGQSEGFLLAINGVSSIGNSSFSTGSFILYQNYPNPFNPVTIINFSISNEEFVSLKIYNNLGEVVAEPVNEIKRAGNHSVKFDARSYSSGVYYYRLSAGNSVQEKKMILLK